MGLYLRKNLINILLFVFLSLQVVPLLKREVMQSMIILDYSIFLSLIFFASLRKWNYGNPIKYAFLVCLALLTFILYILGFAGSISGYVLCAAVPYFIFMTVQSNEEILKTFFGPIKWTSILLMLFGALLFYTLKDQLTNFRLLNAYFIKASINYVALLFYGFSMLYLVLYELKKERIGKLPMVDFVIGLLLMASSILYSAAYLTRSTFIASILILVIYLRNYKFILLAAGIFGFVWFYGPLMQALIEFMGSDSVGDLAAQDIRMNSAMFLISNAVSFNYDFSNTMSASSLLNLFFCFYPLTLYFIFELFYTGYNLLLLEDWNKKLYYFAVLGIAVFIPMYQMDFLSIFVLFTVAQLINFENKTIITY